MFSGLPHTHSLGSAVRLRHLRSGVERPIPFQDRFYDPNYQTMRKFRFKLMPVRVHVLTVYHTLKLTPSPEDPASICQICLLPKASILKI